MSRSPDRPTRRRAVRLGTALGGVAAVAAALAPGAPAAFTPAAPCSGQSVIGRGASFQAAAQAAFFTDFKFSFCGGAAPAVSYQPTGSGSGRRSVGARTNGSSSNPPEPDNTSGSFSRNQPPRFAATDEPLTSGQRSDIEKGTDATGDESPVHEIPVTVGAVAVIVHFPEGCDVHSIPAANQTIPGADPTNLDRAQLTKAQLEAVWFGKGSDTGGTIQTWGDLFSGLTAVPGGPKTTPECQAQPIKRIKRFDDSGTTFAFKDELNAANPARGWLTTYITPDTRTWPNCTTPDDKTRCLDAGANGGAKLAQTVAAAANDGSIGYADLATARDNQFFKVPTSATNTTVDYTYWTPIENGTAGTFVDPPADPASYRSASNRGANCAQTMFKNLPTAANSPNGDPTLGDWSKTSGVDAPTGYPICTLTYELAFDDNASAYGNTPGEESQARTVKEYLTYIAGDGQRVLFGADYSPLPKAPGQQDILGIAKTGVNAIGFNKAGDAVIKPPPGGGTPPPGGGGTPPPPPGSGTPSNRFTIVSISIVKNGGIVLRIRVGSRGRLSISGSGRYRAGRKTKLLRSIGGISVLPRSGGTIRIGFRPSSRLIKAAKKYKSVKLKLKISYTPTGGSRRVAFKTVTFKVKSRSRR